MKGIIRNLILFLVIGGILAGGFYYFFNKNTPEEANITSSSAPSNPAVNSANNLPATSISGINLDTSIFSNPAFLSLRDSSVILIPRGNEGRPNPFAPIGIDKVPDTLNTISAPADLNAESDASILQNTNSATSNTN